MQVLLPQLLARLPIAEKAKLAKLLPGPDLEGASASNPIPDAFSSPSNVHFWDATRQFQVTLAAGGFDPENIKRREEMQKEDSFKDDNYEAYWCERLQRDKKQKAKARARAERSANRGRESRQSGRGSHCAGARRDKGKGKAIN